MQQIDCMLSGFCMCTDGRAVFTFLCYFITSIHSYIVSLSFKFFILQYIVPEPKIPKRSIIYAVVLFVAGSIMLTLGSLFFTGLLTGDVCRVFFELMCLCDFMHVDPSTIDLIMSIHVCIKTARRADTFTHLSAPLKFQYSHAFSQFLSGF